MRDVGRVGGGNVEVSEAEEMASRHVASGGGGGGGGFGVRLCDSDYAEKLRSVKFLKCRAVPCIFYCAELQLREVVHGDDFTFLAYSWR